MSITKNYFGLVTVLSKFLNQTCLRGKRFRTADLAVALKLVVKAEEYGLEVGKYAVLQPRKYLTMPLEMQRRLH